MPPAARRQATRAVKSTVKDGPLITERRDQLVSAAVQVFKAKGFHEATIRDIGTLAGMTQGTIYNYVQSKDDILYLVCDRLVSQYQEETERALSATKDSAKRLEAVATVLAEVIFDHQDEILLIYQNTHLLDRKALRVILARVQGFVETFEALIQESAARAGIKLDDPYIAAHIFTFLPTIVALRRWAFGRSVPRERLVATISKFLVRGVGLG